MRKNAFTILELLVAVSIISVLIALLFPMLGSAKQSSARIMCQVNMRQLAAGVLTYASDNDGQLPYCNWDGNADDTGPYGHGWLFSSPQFRTGYPATSDLNGNWTNRAHEPQDGVMTGVIWPYIHTLSAYHCPIDNPEFYTGTEWLTSYLYNGAQCGYGAKGNMSTDTSPGLHLRQMKAPAQSNMMWEAMEQFYQGQNFTGAIWNDGSSWPSEEVLAARHYKGANVSFFDGHVEWWDPNTWAYWVSRPNFSRLYCCPLTAAGR